MTDKTEDLDLDQLRKLLVDINKLELSSREINKFSWPIYYFNENGWGSESKRIFVHLRKTENITSSAAEKLLDFIKKNILLDTNEILILGFYVDLIDILLDTLNKNEIKGNVENKDCTHPCNLNSQQLSEVIKSQIELCLFKKQGITKVKLISTLCPIEMQEINELVFIQNEKLSVKIREWNDTERAVFASVHGYNKLWILEKKSPMDLKVFLEIEYAFSKDEFDITLDKKYQDYLFGLIDLIKWAIMVLSKKPYPVSEGTCFLTICNPQRIEMILRDYNMCDTVNNGHHSHNFVKPEMVNEVKQLIEDFYTTLKEFGDLQDALHFFGRACIAALHRDRLIDSVIGLEIILLQGHEQLGYQFRLHGATILSIQWDDYKISNFEGENELFWKKENLVKWFKDIYGKRSTSVHGSSQEYTENDSAPVLYSFAVIIKGIIYLHKNGFLHDDNNKISGAIGNYVIDKLVLKNVD